MSKLSKGTFDVYNKGMSRRDYKEFSSDSIFHVYNRGNNKEKIFLDAQDYKAFLLRLGLCLGFSEEELNKEKLIALPYSRIRITGSNKDDFKLHAFSLMPNHFHLLIGQDGEVPISNIMLRICTSYAKYFNKKYKRVGHVFQDQFKSVLIENNAQFMWASSYIHMNPVKDRLVKFPSEHTWSSYTDFATDRNLPFVSRELLLLTFESKENFIHQTLNFKQPEDVKGAL